MRNCASLTLLRTVVVFLLGLVAGVQTALYMFDLYDDGVAEPLTGLLGVGFIVLGLAVAIWPYRGRRSQVTPDGQDASEQV